MPYKITHRIFKAPNKEQMRFYFREDSNDLSTIHAAFCEDEYKILDLKFKKGDIVIDIGAHIGAVTLLLATIRPDLKIFSYEPVKQNFELLKRNIEENSPSSEVSIFNQAVWFYDDDFVKVYYGDKSHTGKVHRFIGSQFMLGGFRNRKSFKKVHTVSLNKTFEDNSIFNCKFMKLDAEGAEYGIFKGTPVEVLRMIERIHGEYHNIDIPRIKKPRKMLLEQTKGVFKDVTGKPEKDIVGPFVFVRK